MKIKLKFALLVYAGISISISYAQIRPNDLYYSQQFSLNYLKENIEINRVSYKLSKKKYKIQKDISCHSMHKMKLY